VAAKAPKAAPKAAPKVAPRKKSPAKPTAAATRAITDFEARFAKTFGAGTLEDVTVRPYEVISSGSLSLDYALGVGGFVEGRLVEIWGNEAIGKSTLGLYHLAAAQQKHPAKKVAIIDVEHKIDLAWAEVHGVNLRGLYLYHPANAEDVADALKEFIRSGIVSAVLVDSIGAMIPEAEKEKDADKVVMALQAKIVTRMVKIAASEAPKTGVSVVVINQVRANLAYGGTTTTSGGFALKHATTMRLKAKRTGTLPFKAKVGGEDIIVGHEVAIYVERNGVAPAYKTAIVTLFNQETEKYGPVGIDKADETVTMGLKTHAIAQRGAWYDTPDGKSYQGRPALVDAVRGDLTLQDQISDLVLATVASTITEEVDPEEIDPDPEAVISPKFRTTASVEAAS